jgi:predicted TPR repeat methyltransferase
LHRNPSTTCERWVSLSLNPSYKLQSMDVRRDLLFQSSGDLLADRRYGFALDLAARGDHAGAVDLLAQAVDIAPRFASAWFALGELHERLGNLADAIAAFHRARDADADDCHGAGLRLAKLGGEGRSAMPPGYVRALFDQYAPRFDAALESLGYRAPALLRDAVKRCCLQRGRQLRFGHALDLGCGTGLAGALFRPLCDRLVGVDLSPAMVAKASQKGLYDRLEVADIGAFMAGERASGSRYDLILAADTLPYFGDLTPLLEKAAALLTPDSLLGFTVETHGGEGVVLGEKLRFAHSAPWVQNALGAAGFTADVLEQTSTRDEAGAPVPSLVVVAGIS